MYFNLSFAFGLRPLAPFIGEGHFVFVAGVVSLALCDLLLMVGTGAWRGGWIESVAFTPSPIEEVRLQPPQHEGGQ